MKKIVLFILMVAFFATTQAQVKKITPIVIKDSVALVADTTIVDSKNWMYDYKWAVHVEQFNLDAADAEVKIQVTMDSTKTDSWIDYDLAATLTLDNSPTNSEAFEDYNLIWNYIRVITIPNSVTSGEYRMTFIAVRNR